MAAKPLSKESRRNLMLTTPMHRLIPQMAVPTIVSMMVTSIYNIINAFFVSSLGTGATAAVGVNFSLENIIMTAGSFLAVGANSYIARLLGARDDKKASQVLSTAFFTAIITGLLVAILGLTFMDQMLRFMGATDGVIQYSRDFAGFALLAAPFMASSFVLNQCLRSEGSAVYSMVGMVSGTILNCALAPLFIFTFDWGVKGASAATALSKTVSFIVLILPYLRRRSLLHLSPRNIKYSRDIVTEVVKMGSPAMLRSGLTALATIVLNRMAGFYSDSVLAGMSVVNRIIMFPTSMILGFGQGYQPVVGFNWGAKRYDRILHAQRFSTFTGLIAGTVMGALIAIFAQPLMQLFTKADAEMVAIGVLSIRMQCLVMPLNAMVMVVNMTYAGTGKATGAALLSLARQGFCLIPMLLLLPPLLGEKGLASAQAASDVLSLFIAVPLAILIIRELQRKLKESQDKLINEAPSEPAVAFADAPDLDVVPAIITEQLTPT